MTRTCGDNGVETAAVRRIEQEYEIRIGQAFSSGHSVVEISRVIGCKRALPVYRILQRKGLINRSLKRTRFRGPAHLHNALKRTGLSFSQWCNAWRFDPRNAEEELSRIDNLSSSGIRLAAGRDFPNLYAKGKGAIDLEEWERELSSSTSGCSYRIDWDPRLEKFLGTITGVESLTIVGKHPSVVMMDLVRVAWLLKAIDLLNTI